MNALPPRGFVETKQPERPKLRDILGPGLVTGASDDDPSGIATYSQAGAQFGYALGWTLVLTYPLMCAIQLISAQIGRVTGHGLAGNMRRHYPAPLLYGLVALLIIANTINLGADLGAMSAALYLLIDGSALVYVAGFAVLTVVLEVFMRYSRYASVLRWLTLSLFAYVATVFVVGVPWTTVGKNLLLPHVSLSSDYLTVVVAVFGTTISPYLFFWQAAEEVEEEKEDPKAKPLIRAPSQAPRELARIQLDTIVGMGFSNLIALFIILTTAATLNAHGVTNIQTSSQAAEALLIAGPFAFTVRRGHCRNRLARRAGPCGQRRLRNRRSPEVARRTCAKAPSRVGLLRNRRGGDVRRRASEFHADRSHQDAILERRNQRRGGGPTDGHDHGGGLATQSDGTIHTFDGTEVSRLDRDRRHGGGCNWNDRDLESVTIA
jgi:NRAMP (natural resistance-associated macrophage protein)-like metal ion transporter